MVLPMRVDARDMPFAHGYFDAAFSIDAFAYFMTDDLYLPYLARFLAPEAQVCIGGHCYASELTAETPREFLWDISRAYHSVSWWRRHFEESGVFNVLYCAEHPRGRELWLDNVRFDLESCHLRDMGDRARENTLHSIVMLLSDTGRFVTHFTLLAEKV
jgi:hypothetical protein